MEKIIYYSSIEREKSLDGWKFTFKTTDGKDVDCTLNKDADTNDSKLISIAEKPEEIFIWLILIKKLLTKMMKFVYFLLLIPKLHFVIFFKR